MWRRCGFRAPEILLGDQEFTAVADCWSLGLTLVDMCGWSFHRIDMQTSRAAAVTYMMVLFRQLGTPIQSSLTELPLWPKKPVCMERQPWPQAIVSRCGAAGLSLLDALLAWEPSARISSEVAAASTFFAPDGLPLVGVEAEIHRAREDRSRSMSAVLPRLDPVGGILPAVVSVLLVSGPFWTDLSCSRAHPSFTPR